jgi:hypothetical protein
VQKLDSAITATMKIVEETPSESPTLATLLALWWISQAKKARYIFSSSVNEFRGAMKTDERFRTTLTKASERIDVVSVSRFSKSY